MTVYKKCPKCGEEVEGVDLGDNGSYLNFDCECGHAWGEECLGDFMDEAEAQVESRVDDVMIENQERKERKG